MVTRPENINPQEWEQALTQARSICMRLFKKGGTPLDALKAYGIHHICSHPNWGVAIETIAYANCSEQLFKKAA